MSEQKRDVHILDNLAQVTEVAIDAFEKISAAAFKDKGHFTIAFSGGKTPISFYQKLSQLKKCPAWGHTDCFSVDERFVPYHHEESNYGLLKRTLLDHMCGEASRFHPIPIENETVESAAEKYEKELKEYFNLKEGELPEFDLIMLGLGSDGHTASLFPNSPYIENTDRLVVSVTHSDFDRVSLTLPVINNAKNIIYLISGESKQEAVKGVIEEQDLKYPATHVDPKGDLFYLIDEAAAKLLSR